MGTHGPPTTVVMIFSKERDDIEGFQLVFVSVADELGEETADGGDPERCHIRNLFPT